MNTTRRKYSILKPLHCVQCPHQLGQGALGGGGIEHRLLQRCVIHTYIHTYIHRHSVPSSAALHGPHTRRHVDDDKYDEDEEEDEEEDGGGGTIEHRLLQRCMIHTYA